MTQEETARRIFDACLEMHREDERGFNYCFHGGEPLLNMELIREITEYAAHYRDRVKLSVQTNGTLLTDELVRYFRENSIEVGISIDGPRELHDRMRHFRNGAGSFEQTMRGIRILQEQGVHFGIISVLSAENTKHMDEMVDFFVENGIYDLSFSIMQKIGRGKDESDAAADGEMLFAGYKTLLDRILAHNRSHPRSEWMSERSLSNLMRSIYQNEKPFMCMNAPCGAARMLLGFDVEGNFYACDNFMNNKEFLIGSLDRGSIMEQLLGSGIRKKAMERRMENLARCRACTWRGLCGGICYSADYYSGAHGVRETEVCALYRKMIPYVIERIDEDPQLPYFIDPGIEDKPFKNVFLSLDQENGSGADENRIDPNLLESLLKVHDIKNGDYVLVYICAGRPESCPDLPEMLTLLRKRRLSCILALTPDAAEILSPDMNWIPDADEPKAVQIDLSACKDPGETAEKLFTYRKDLKKEYSIYLSVKADAVSWDHGLMTLLRGELREDDRILLTPPDRTEENDRLLNDLLETFRQQDMAENVVLTACDEERLQKRNYDYLVRQSDTKQEYLWIDSGCLEGKNLEKPPFPVL